MTTLQQKLLTKRETATPQAAHKKADILNLQINQRPQTYIYKLLTKVVT